MKNYENYLASEYWQAVAKAVKKRAGYRCQVCNSQHDLEAHHRTYDHRGDELNHLEDLTCLCRRCHAIFHGKFEKPVVHQPKLKVRPVEARKPEAVSVTTTHYKFADLFKPVKARCYSELSREQIDWVEQNLPADGWVELTSEAIQLCRTEANGFTNETIRAWGVRPPLIKGWVGRLKGVMIRREDYRKALAGRFIYDSGKLT